jgi:hypothetical protein
MRGSKTWDEQRRQEQFSAKWIRFAVKIAA